MINVMAKHLYALKYIRIICGYEQKCVNLRSSSINGIMTTKKEARKLNRIKAVLAETGHTGKWLAEQLGKDPATVSKWCTNTSQPDLITLTEISNIINVNVRELIVSNK